MMMISWTVLAYLNTEIHFYKFIFLDSEQILSKASVLQAALIISHNCNKSCYHLSSACYVLALF